MVRMGMRDEDVLDGLAAQGIEHRLDVAGKRWPRINESHPPVADDKGRRAGTCEGPWIPGDDPPDQRRNGFENGVLKREIVVEVDVCHSRIIIRVYQNTCQPFLLYVLRSTYATRLSAELWRTNGSRNCCAKVLKKYSQVKL